MPSTRRVLAASLRLTLFIILGTATLIAQEVSGPKNQPSRNSSIDAMVGLQYLRKDTLNTYMSAQGNPTFSRYNTIVGISFAKSFEAENDKGADFFFTFQYQIPDVIKGVDSINYSFTGYQIGLCIGGKDIFDDNKDLDLVYGLGLQIGGYYLRREILTFPYTMAKTRNGIIAPQLVMEARYFIGDLKVGFKMRGQYDISNTNWIQLDSTPLVFGGFSATGFAFQLTVGYKL